MTFPYPTPPPSVCSTSPARSPSPSAFHVSNRSTQTLRNSDQTVLREQNMSNRSGLRNEYCWIPTLEEVSQADPIQRRRMFQRLAEEARQDDRRSLQKLQQAPSQPQRTSIGQTSTQQESRFNSMEKPTRFHEIGAAALQLLRPSDPYPIKRYPTVTSSGFLSPELSEGQTQAVIPIASDEVLFSEWCKEIPESPAWNSETRILSEDDIAKWVEEDREYERERQERRAWVLRRVI